MHTKRQLAVGLGLAVAAALANSSAKAVDFTTADDTWKFSVNGNINVDYIYSSCQNASNAAAITTVGGACTGTQSGNSTSSVSNGLLPAAITFGVATTQNGFDIAAHFGFYPGIATNDGGSPNLQQSGGAENVGLGTTGLDIRQVFMTFGNKDIGTFTLGRNFGLFGFDAIINDMTLPGVGVAGAAATASPANTTLGSIGFGYIYTDTLAQIDYTTPTVAGLNLTVGIFNPVNSLTDTGTAAPKKAPGVHGKITYTYKMSDDMKFYASATGIWQKQDFQPTAFTAVQYTSRGADAFVQAKIYGFEFDASAYYGKGMGTTGLFILSDDGFGNARKSYGGLIQGTYTIGADKFGVNYGTSRLSYANALDALAIPNLLFNNSKVTAGNYYSLTKNLTLLSEVSRVYTQAHNGAENKAWTINAGAYLSF
jgi:hypothetical protein